MKVTSEPKLKQIIDFSTLSLMKKDYYTSLNEATALKGDAHF